MKRLRIGVMTGFVLMAFLSVSCGQNRQSSPGVTAAPNFVLKKADGTAVELKSLKGKVVVVNFWATWCGPCKAEIPAMMNVYEKYHGKGLEIVGIALDNGGWSDVGPYVAKVKINYPIVLGDEEVVKLYGEIDAIPTTVIVDRKGNIVARHVGMMSQGQFEAQERDLL